MSVATGLHHWQEISFRYLYILEPMAWTLLYMFIITSISLILLYA